MLSAETIPQFTDKTLTGAQAWWDSMLEKGLYIHPEDDPVDIVDDTGKRLLDDTACVKLTSIYEDMFSCIGEQETYDIGVNSFFKYQGYEWDIVKEEFIPRE